MARSRQIPNFARSIAHQCSVSAGHLLYRMIEEGRDELWIDLKHRRIHPAHFEVWRNMCLVSLLCSSFLRLQEMVPHVEIERADLRIRLSMREVEPGVVFGVADYRTEIAAADGRRWQGGLEVERPSISP